MKRQVPARADLIALNIDRSISVGSFIATREEGELVCHAANAYGFVFRSEEFAFPSKVSLGAFAKAIEKVYDCAEGVNRAVVTALKSVHARMIEAEAAGRMLEV